VPALVWFKTTAPVRFAHRTGSEIDVRFSHRTYLVGETVDVNDAMDLAHNDRADESAAQPLGSLAGQQAGPYLLIERLGGGAMASVYRAVDTRRNRPVAVKVLLPDADATMRARFRQEARTHSNLRHPNIVPIYDVGQDNGLTYIVMELIEGPSLADLMEETVRLAPNDAARLLEPIARALDYANRRGVVHRDVKPSNVLLRMVDGHGDHAVRIGALAYAVTPLLSDFGIARALDAPELTNVGRTVGTPTYMSPEQCADSHEIDGRSDLYSLGAVFYRCIVGRPPFAGSTTQILHAHVYDPLTIPDELVDTLPPLAVRLLQRSLAKEAGQRYADGSEMARDLAVLAGSPPLALRAGEATATMDTVPAVRPASSAAVIVPAPTATTPPRAFADAPPVYAARPITPASVTTVRPRRQWFGAVLGTLLAAVVLAAGIGLALNLLPFDLLPAAASATPTPAVVADSGVATLPPVTAPALVTEQPDDNGAVLPATATSPAPATPEAALTVAPVTTPTAAAATPQDATPTPQPTPAGSISNYWREAEDAFAERDWEVALEYITLVRRIDPTFSQGVIDQMLGTIHTQLAAASIADGQPDAALAAINAAIVAQPGNPQLVAIQRALESLVAPNTLDKVMARWTLAAELLAFGQNLLGAERPCDATRQFQAAGAILPDSDVTRLAAESQALCTRQRTEAAMRDALADLGGRLLYSTQENGRYRIYRAPAAENAVATLLVEDARQPALQPNGPLLAFHTTRSGEAGILLFDVTAGLAPTARSGQLAGAPEDGLDAPASWSGAADQAFFASTAFGDGRSRLLLTVTGDPGVRQDRGLGRDPAWSPAADRVVYNGVGDSGNEPGLWLMNSDGSNRVRLTDNGNDIRPTWSPEGRYIVFMSTRSGGWDLYRYDLQEGALRRLTDDPAQDGLPAVSPDGRWVAFASDRDGFWRIWVTSIDGGLALPFAPINGILVNWLEHAIQWLG
jgi:serine/threonine protein kinase